MTSLRYCKNCNEYTLSDTCKRCSKKTISKYPPRYSPQDHYGRFRRKLKKNREGVT